MTSFPIQLQKLNVSIQHDSGHRFKRLLSLAVNTSTKANSAAVASLQQSDAVSVNSLPSTAGKVFSTMAVPFESHTGISLTWQAGSESTMARDSLLGPPIG